jgi:hypothetical protein
MRWGSSSYHRIAAILLVLLGACGDDSSADSGMLDSTTSDTMVADTAPPNPCWAEDLSPPCCYSRSNTDRLDNPQLKFVDFDSLLPEALSSSAAAFGVTQATRLDALMFGFELQGAAEDGPITLKIGSLLKETVDGATVYSWPDGNAPGPAEATRWDPVLVPGTIAGGVVSSEVVARELTVPFFDQDRVSTSELVLLDSQMVSPDVSTRPPGWSSWTPFMAAINPEGRSSRPHTMTAPRI